MTKRVGILSLILAAGMAIFQPVAALAQDRFYRDRDSRDRDSRRERVYRAPDRRDSRGRDWRGSNGRRYQFVDRYRGGYFYNTPRYNTYYGPVRPYNCR
ncbi:MAG TPA: hypothetical protein VK604_17245 [Bryobacteraceae bacterium]|nr:hypothetical protein [Bryobacteraceae bacterium]